MSDISAGDAEVGSPLPFYASQTFNDFRVDVNAEISAAKSIEATSRLVVSNNVTEHTGQTDSNNNIRTNMLSNEMQVNTPVAIDINNNEIKNEQI